MLSPWFTVTLFRTSIGYFKYTITRNPGYAQHFFTTAPNSLWARLLLAPSGITPYNTVDVFTGSYLTIGPGKSGYVANDLASNTWNYGTV